MSRVDYIPVLFFKLPVPVEPGVCSSLGGGGGGADSATLEYSKARFFFQILPFSAKYDVILHSPVGSVVTIVGGGGVVFVADMVVESEGVVGMRWDASGSCYHIAFHDVMDCSIFGVLTLYTRTTLWAETVPRTAHLRYIS